MGRRYNYDPRRATVAEPLPAVLRRCQIKGRMEDIAGIKKLTVSIGDSSGTKHEFDRLAKLTKDGIEVYLALNPSETVPDNVMSYYGNGTSMIVIACDNLIERAEDAYNLYVQRRVEPGSIYSEDHLAIIADARAFLRNEKIKRRRVWEINELTLPIFLDLVFEWRDYQRLGISRTNFVNAHVLNKALTHTAAQLVQLTLVEGGVPESMIVKAGRLWEIAFGPFPMMRLSDFNRAAPDVLEAILAEDEPNRLLEMIQTSPWNPINTDGIHLARKKIESVRHSAQRALAKMLAGTAYSGTLRVITSTAYNGLSDALRNVRSLYFEEPAVERIENPPEETPERTVAPEPVATEGMRPRIEPVTAVVQIKKPLLTEFIEACKSQFLGGPGDILTALHDIAKNKEIEFTIKHPENLINLITKYMKQLQVRYFDVKSVIAEIEEKARKSAA